MQPTRTSLRRLIVTAMSALMLILVALIHPVSAQGTAIALNFDSLPSIQGWRYETDSGLPETTFFSVSNGTLYQDTMSIGNHYAGYRRDGDVDSTLPFTLRVRLRVPESSGEVPAGFAFVVQTETEAFEIDLKPDSIRFWPGTVVTPFDNTVFHEYRLEGSPGVEYRLFVDDILVLAGAPSPYYTSPSYLFVGDGSNGGNARAEVTHFSFQQPSNTPPLVDAGGPYTVMEGGTVSVAATGSDAEDVSLTYVWDLDDDGTFETPGQTVTFSAAGLIAPSSRTIKVQIIDSGGLSATDQAIVNVDVLNVAPMYLHGTGPNANPPTLFLDSVASTVTTAKYKDSSSVTFGGGNPWKDVGTWTTTPALSAGTMTSLSDLQVWLGLKNSDDQGTRFDLRAEVYQNGSLVAAGETYCITDITRNPSLAKDAVVSFDPFSPVAFNGTTDVLSLKVLTRIGTNGAGDFCGGHSNAVGLRLYFDAVSRPSKFDATFEP